MLLRRAFAVSSNRHLSSAFNADTLLAEENRARCIDCLKRPAGLPFKAESAKAYAAVLVPVCVARSGQIGLLFTRRSGTISRHVHQVSFPGGMKDPTDKSYEDCALRETEEEIGLPRSRVQVWGSADLIRLPRSAAIMPVLGTIENLSIDELNLNKDEVEEAFVVPIQKLCSPEVRRHTQFRSTNIAGYSGPSFVIDSTTRIWGITGYVTNLFLSCFLPKGTYNGKVEYIRPYRGS